MTAMGSSRAAITAFRRIAAIQPTLAPLARALSTASTPPTPSPSSSKSKKPISSDPYPLTTRPQFPAPNDPFAAQAAAAAAQAAVDADKAAATVASASASAAAASAQAPKQYSDTTKTLVRGVARLMGYNSRASTTIRETGRMMRGVVDAVESERSFWYDACGLPPTYQSFFQLHLLYILVLLTRLRALPATAAPRLSTVPEPLSPSEPLDEISPESSSSSSSSSSSTSPSSSTGLIGKPNYEAYPTELLSHFFELAESQMRMVLGRGERESVIRKYMDEMGEQWKGAGTGLDYVLGLGMSEVAEERARADTELASWAWRNLFASKGLTAAVPTTPTSPEELDALDSNELAFVRQLELVVRFVRREMSRLDQISDEDVLSGDIGEWGRVEQ